MENSDTSKTVSTVSETHLSESRLHQLVPKIGRLTKGDLSIIKKEKISLKLGKFTNKENKILTKNWHLFCNEHCVNEPHFVFGFFVNGENTSKTVKDNVKYLRNECKLFLRLAKGLPNRTLNSIYQRSRQIFSGLNRSKDLSVEERQYVINLYRRFPNQWNKIAERTYCHPKSIQQIIRNKFKSIRNETISVRKGKWTEEEDNCLIKAIEKVLRVQTPLTKHHFKHINEISWTSVANFVEKRSSAQCRQHWYSSVYFRIINQNSNNISRKWKKKLDSLKLIYFMKHNNYKSELKIDWNSLKEKFAHVVNYNKLVRIWRDMKASVPDRKSKKFREIIEWLFNNKISRFSVTERDYKIIEKFCKD